ncbi:MAG: L-histidine N(alpha)-methyltransferase [Patescibacteria group bacterium]
MVTLSNAEISRLYKVTRATVTNWVSNSIAGENNLELTTNNNKVQVVKNQNNLAELQRLKESGKKHANKSSYLEIEPSKEFYKLFNEEQAIEIVNSLKTSKEINLKYTYLNGGAAIWNEYHEKSVEKGEYPATKKESKMLCQSFEFLKDRLEKSQMVNVIDIGPGNGLVVKEFISKLSKDNRIFTYISIDISREMNEIAISNINTWFPEIDTLSYIRDIENETIADILFKNKKGENVTNIILFTGGTIGSVQDRHQILKNLRNSIDQNDVIIVTTKLDNITERVELNHVKDKFSRLLWIPELIGIDVNNCEVIKKYNTNINSKAAYILLDKDYKINFKIDGASTSVFLSRNDEILIWKFHLSTISELFDELNKSNLRVIQLLTEKKYEYILVSCESMV